MRGSKVCGRNKAKQERNGKAYKAEREIGTVKTKRRPSVKPEMVVGEHLRAGACGCDGPLEGPRGTLIFAAGWALGMWVDGGKALGGDWYSPGGAHVSDVAEMTHVFFFDSSIDGRESLPLGMWLDSGLHGGSRGVL